MTTDLEQFWADEPANFPTRDSRLAATVDKLEEQAAVLPADRDGSEQRVLPPVYRGKAEPVGVATADSEDAPIHRAADALERNEGICRTCLAPIWNEGGTVGHIKRAEGWSDRIERGGDSLVCFKAVDYRHVPLEGREAAIYDRAHERGAAAAVAAEAERDEIAGRLSSLLCELTNGRMSKTNYDVRTMVTEIDSAYDEAQQEDRAEQDRLAETLAKVREWADTRSRDVMVLGGRKSTRYVRTDLAVAADQVTAILDGPKAEGDES